MNEARLTNGPPAARVQWGSVALFYAVACSISWPLFWWRDFRPESWRAWNAPELLKGLLPASGPFLGALVASIVFRRSHRRTVTLWGTSLIRSLVFLAVPLIGLTTLGLGDDEPHLTGLLFGLAFLVYALGEESGWRGFLEDALNPLPPLRRYILIGLLWGAWHFTTFVRGEPSAVAIRLTILSSLWILGSWGMGNAMKISHSLLVAAMLHLMYNFSVNLPKDTAWIVLGTSGATWFMLLRTWRRSEPSNVSQVQSL